MNWAEVCEDPNLQNLPFKIELNEQGNLVMSSVKFDHSAYQGESIYLLRALSKQGRALAECAVATPSGTKVADVAWVSPEGAEEVWICRESGDLYFYSQTGKVKHSQLVPDFPEHIDM